MGNKPNKGDKDNSKGGGELFKPVEPPPSARPPRREREGQVLGIQELDDISRNASDENFKKTKVVRPSEDISNILDDQNLVGASSNTASNAPAGAVTDAASIAIEATGELPSSSSIEKTCDTAETYNNSTCIESVTAPAVKETTVASTAVTDCSGVDITERSLTNHTTERSLTNPSPPTGQPPSYISPRFTLPLHTNVPTLPTSNAGRVNNEDATLRSQRDDMMKSNRLSNTGSKKSPRFSGNKKNNMNMEKKRMNMRGNNDNTGSNSVSNNSGGARVHKQDEIDYRLTEGANRRNAMADCEAVCSCISEGIYVGGHKIARSAEIIGSFNITQIVNCSASVVQNYFDDDSNITYLALNMVDGRQDDISWFVCDVIKFVENGRRCNLNTLIHCEKGISRSCSFSIAYLMWKNKISMKEAFSRVKSNRSVCNPNSAFTCQLLELGELFSVEGKLIPLVWRCASHGEYDPSCPVLKVCRRVDDRKPITPVSSLLDPQGVFVIRHFSFNADRGGVRANNRNGNEKGRGGDKRKGSRRQVSGPGRSQGQRESGSTNTEDMCNYLYVWQGEEASDEVVLLVERKLEDFRSIFVSESCEIVLIKQGKETEDFWKACKRQASDAKNNFIFDDLYKLSNMSIDEVEGEYRHEQQRSSGDNAAGLEVMGDSPLKKFKPHIRNYREDMETLNLQSNSPVSGSVSQQMKDLSINIPEGKLKDRDSTVGNESSKIAAESHTKKFSLPLASIQPEISPSIRERHPDFVDVLRAPVSSEELIQLKRSGNSSDLSVNKSVSTSSPDRNNEEVIKYTSHIDSNDDMKIASPKMTVPSLALPSIEISSQSPCEPQLKQGDRDVDDCIPRVDKSRLLQAVKSDDIENSHGRMVNEKMEWSDLGPYDQQDLDEDSIFLLVHPGGKNYIWVGSKYRGADEVAVDGGALVRTLAHEINDGDLNNANVNIYFLKQDILDEQKCSIIVSGAETEEFWEIFDSN